MSASRRPPPPDAVSPRRAAEGVGRALQQAVPVPERSFGEEIVEETWDVLRSHLSGACELGPYNEGEDQSLRPDAPGRLGGQPRAILFDGEWWEWFARRTPEQRRVLGALARYLAGNDKRLPALIEMIDHHIEHGIAVRGRKRLMRSGVALAVAAFAAVQWGANVVEWGVGKIPLVKTIVSLWKGSPP